MTRGVGPGWLFFILASLAVASAACQSGQSPGQQAESQVPEFKPDATVKDLMLSIIDPSADVVWLSVKSDLTTSGFVDTAPRNDEEWQAVRHGAITLAEGANMLMVPGRHVAKPGETSDTPGVELEPQEMERLINADRAAWNTRARALHDASMAVLRAIDAHDAEQVFQRGADIDEACENCHIHYWYPNEKIPEFPSARQ